MQPIKPKNINYIRPEKADRRINYSLLSLAVIFVIGVSAGGYYIFNKQNKKQSSVVPTAFASDIPGWWYQEHFGKSFCDAEFCRAESDPDNDKLTNSQEFYYQTDPYDTDTNDNGLTDGEDVAQDFVPSKPGKVTFEQAASDENIYKESLGFADDIEEDFKESWDISKVHIPLPSDIELNIISKSSDTKIYQEYVNAVAKVVESYFPNSKVDEIASRLESNDDVSDISAKSIGLSQALKEVPTPEDLVVLHKYNIAMYRLMAEIVTPPSEEELKDTANVSANLWYEKTKAFLALTQKIAFEYERLENIR